MCRGYSGEFCENESEFTIDIGFDGGKIYSGSESYVEFEIVASGGGGIPPIKSFEVTEASGISTSDIVMSDDNVYEVNFKADNVTSPEEAYIIVTATSEGGAKKRKRVDLFIEVLDSILSSREILFLFIQKDHRMLVKNISILIFNGQKGHLKP